MKYSLLGLVLIAISFMSNVPANKRTHQEKESVNPPFVGYTSQWVDSVFNTLTLDEKIGQLFMVPVYPITQNPSEIDDLIKKYHIGGLIYFKAHPSQVAQLTNRFQKISKIPLMTGIDGEWGVAMRLDSVPKFPYQMMLGAISDDKLIYQMGAEIAHQCRTLGININFAPVIDINNNPANPVIGIRSFGENKIEVARKGYAYALGMQDSCVLAVAKHFPGHGDTDKDSHKDLPVINASLKTLDTLELFPFKQLINEGIGGVMVAHLYVPSLDKTSNLPSTLSKKIVKDLLRNKYKFKGLIFTDALGMQGVAKYYGPGIAEVKALQAGNDVLLMSKDVPKAFEAIKNAVKSGKITEQQLDQSVKRILYAKYWFNLNKFKPLKIKNIQKQLNRPEVELLNRRLIENALTLIKNDDAIIPFVELKNVKFASVSIADGNKTVFQNYLSRYAKIDHYQISKNAPSSEFEKLKNKLKNYDYVIIGIHKVSPFGIRTYGISLNTVNFVNSIVKQNKVIIDLFGNPYALNRFRNIQKAKAILISYEDNRLIEELSAQLLFGGIKAKGKLPVTINGFEKGTGKFTMQIRLKYSIPEELGIDRKKLLPIDTLIYWAIGQKAFPGCEIMAIKDGTVFFRKTYGFHTYSLHQRVKWDDVFDLASVTKITATMPALMKLYEEKKFCVDDKLSDYLPETDSTNKGDLIIRDILTHQARLQPWLPLTLLVEHRGRWDNTRLSRKKTDKFCIQVAKNLYTTKEVDSLIYQQIYKSALLRHKRYRYSDLGFYLFRKIIEKQTAEPMDKFLRENFYESLGAYTMGYNPVNHGISVSKILPTEYDIRFRKQLLHGYVHDPGAALLGGVSGHAGLFASADDLAKLLQMYLQGGYYGGHRYFNEKTIDYFTTKPYSTSRRALGFDSTDGRGEGPACSLTSASSYGHLGFTGIMVWVDPKYDFIYIFLSNRVYPTSENKRIIKYDIRERVQRIFYNAFVHYSK